MNITLPQDSLRIDHDFYKTLTPCKRKTFSETMLIRRTPFLQCENENSQQSYKINQNDSASCRKKLKYSENKENQIRTHENFQKNASNTHNLKSKEKSIDNCASNTSVKINKQTSGTITTPQTSLDHKNNVETTGTETLTKNANKPEFETENWLKLQNDLKNLKHRRGNCIHKRQRSEFNIEITENETQKENKRKFNHILEIETKEIENIDFKEKQTNSLRNLPIETQSKTTTNETSIYEESTQISGYYSEVSIDELQSILEIDTSTEIPLKPLNDQIKPLTNSTFIWSEETSENETQEYETAASSFKENGNETYDVEINNKTRNIEDKPKNNKDSNNSPKKYPFYRPENFQIPLIIINEIEIIHHGLKTTEIETKTLNGLKVPKISIQSEFEENKELHKKLIKMKLHKQIEIKDKVMAQLLEIAVAIDFPKLKHLCNLLCEKDDDGCCKKMQIEVEKGKKMEDESGGFFYSIWSAIKYPFVSNPNKSEEKEDLESKKIEVKEKTKKEEKLEENISEVAENIKKDLQKDDSIEVVKVENSERVILPNSLDKKRITKPENIKPTDRIDDNGSKKELKDDIKLEMKDKKDTGPENEEKIEDLLKEAKKEKELINRKIDHGTNDKTKDFIEKKAEDLKETTENCDKFKDTKEADNKMEATDNTIEENETKSNAEKDTNSNKKADKTNTKQTANLESNKNPESQQKDKKEIKKKKGFFSFFSKKDKTKNDKKTSKESTIEDSKKIDNMEEILQQLEKEKLEISKESLKKLDNFMAEKVSEQNTESKARMKRAGSF